MILFSNSFFGKKVTIIVLHSTAWFTVTIQLIHCSDSHPKIRHGWIQMILCNLKGDSVAQSSTVTLKLSQCLDTRHEKKNMSR